MIEMLIQALQQRETQNCRISVKPPYCRLCTLCRSITWLKHLTHHLQRDIIFDTATRTQHTNSHDGYFPRCFSVFYAVQRPKYSSEIAARYCGRDSSVTCQRVATEHWTENRTFRIARRRFCHWDALVAHWKKKIAPHSAPWWGEWYKGRLANWLWRSP